MPDMRESLFWDKELERKEGLPDTRLRYGDREKLQRRLGRMEMDIVFCAQCGGQFGLVPVHCPYVYFVCDSCFLAANNIAPPGMRQLTDEEERAMKTGKPPS